jgi:predicted metal-dependent phosphoesterase TrpH
MHPAIEKATALFHDLGTPEALSARAAEGFAPRSRPRVNAHIHLPPNFSAFETVAQAVDLAAEQDVRVLGVSNYYDYSVYADFAARAEERGIFPLFGLEIIARIEDLARAGIKINDPGNPGKMYICGKGITRFDPMSTEASALLEVIRSKDSERMARMTARLAEVFSAAGLETGLDAEAVKQRVVRRHGSPRETVYLQERHVAQAFQEALFEQRPAARRGEALERIFGVPASAGVEEAVAVQNEIRSHLMKAGKPAYVAETFVDFDHAYRLILALGGIPCYPTLADGAEPICPYEDPVEKLIAEIRARGIHFVEFIPVRNSPEALTRYVRTMRRAGLVATAGTEHNTRDLLPIEPTCVDGQAIPEELREIFWEGACVIAAHQYLRLQGRPGFVDDRGRPNPAYGSDEVRIAAFRSLGAAVIRQYQENRSRI